MSDFVEDCDYVRQALAKLTVLRDQMHKHVMDEWTIGDDNQKVVDIGNAVWVTVEDSSSYTDQPNPVADWIALFNPALVGDLLEVIDSHLQGLEHLWATSPDELREHIQVSGAVKKWAESVQNYLLKHEVVNEDGEWMQPRRRLQVTEWS